MKNTVYVVGMGVGQEGRAEEVRRLLASAARYCNQTNDLMSSLWSRPESLLVFDETDL